MRKTSRSRPSTLFRVVLTSLWFLLALHQGSMGVVRTCPDPVPGSGITVLTPNGCEPYRFGDTIEVTWEIDTARAGLVVSFSPDNGRNTFVIGDVPLWHADYKRRRFVWEVPDTVSTLDQSLRMSAASDSCVIEIAEYLAGGFYGASARFSIRSKTLRIMPFGDSRTAGPRPRDCYRLYLDRMMTAAGYSFDFVGSQKGYEASDYPGDSIFDVNHQGMWGWPTNNLIPRLGGWVRAAGPDIVLALLGTTDILQESDSLDVKVARTVREIETVIDTLRSVNPSIAILLSNVYPVNSLAFTDQLNALNQHIPDLAARRTTAQSPVIFIDIWTGFNRIGDLTDIWHANQGGCTKIARQWLDGLWPFFDTLPPASARRLAPAAPLIGGPRPAYISLLDGLHYPVRDIFTVTGRRIAAPILLPETKRHRPVPFLPAIAIPADPRDRIMKRAENAKGK